MKIGLGIGIPFIRNYISSLFDPSKLFTGSTNGVWYDPSDINLTWRRNLLTYSEQFDNAAWTKKDLNTTGTPTWVNVATAPDGSTTAEKLIPNSGAQTLVGITRTIAGAVGYTWSIYAKAAEFFWIALETGNRDLTWFNVSAGTVGTTSSNHTALITPVGNGWHHCSITTKTIWNGAVQAWAVNGNNTQSATGDGTSGIYIWGAQLEVGSTATPYQRITDGIQDYLQYQAQPVMYRDAAGTQPVTAVEQPVGLMLDKSKGLVLGPELVTNGDFSTDTAWTKSTASVTISGGSLNFNSSTGYAQQASSAWNGSFVELTIVVSSISAGAVYLGWDGGVSTPNITAAGTYTYRRRNASNNFYVIASGTTTATVDLVSMKAIQGNHAFNSSGNSANFPVLSARYNLLTKTEQFDDAVWTKAGGTNYANSTTAPDGTQTGALFIENTASGTHGYWQATSSILSGVSAKYTIRLKYHSRRYVRVAWVTGGGAESVYVDVDLIAGVVVNQGPYGVSTTQTSASITSAGLGWYTVEIKGTLPSATTYATVYARNSSTNSNPESAFGYVGDGASGFYIWGADLRVANDALNQPAYQRVNTSTDYDTVGFKPYLRFNGTNQWLQTNSIDFTYGDKMFVSAGVRKLSDATVGIVAELSANINTNTGAFNLLAPGNPTPQADYVVASRGSAFAGSNTARYAINSPNTSVVTLKADIAGDLVALRTNGVDRASGTGDQGTGNYGNYPLYIGARSGSSLWFSGRLYSLIVAGKLANAVEITETEKYVNGKTAAY